MKGFVQGSASASIYVNRLSDTVLWYMWDKANNTHVALPSNSLEGRVVGLELFEAEFKGRKNTKLNILVDVGGEVYRLITGIKTLFARGVLAILASESFDYGDDCIISVMPADADKVVFCRITQNGKSVPTEDWDMTLSEETLKANAALINSAIKAYEPLSVEDFDGIAEEEEEAAFEV